MSRLAARATAAGLVAGLALALAACGGGEETTGETSLNELDSNLLLDEPANDASAMESVVNSVEPAPAANEVEEPTNATGDVLGETSGGDTGGNTVESNVSGM